VRPILRRVAPPGRGRAAAARSPCSNPSGSCMPGRGCG